MIARVSVDGFGVFRTFVQDRQLDVGTRAAGQDFDGFVRAHPLGRLAVDLDDLVARQDPRLISGRTDHRGDHPEPAALGIKINLNADAAELAFDLPSELLPLAGVDERRVGVQVLEHALEGIFKQLAPRDRPDIIQLDLLDRIDEQAVKLEHFVLRLGPLRRLPAAHADRGDQSRSRKNSGAASASALLKHPGRSCVHSMATEFGLSTRNSSRKSFQPRSWLFLSQSVVDC